MVDQNYLNSSHLVVATTAGLNSLATGALHDGQVCVVIGAITSPVVLAADAPLFLLLKSATNAISANVFASLESIGTGSAAVPQSPGRWIRIATTFTVP